MVDVIALRAATPGCERVVHLNNAGTALPTAETLRTVTGHLELEAAVGGYEAADIVASATAAIKVSAARLINASAGEIALTESDSAAFNRAFWSFVVGGWLRPGDAVVVDRLAYDSHHIAVLQASRFVGFDVVVADHPDAWPARTRLVTYTAIGTHSGHVRDLDGVGAAATDRSIPFLLDGCQALGHVPVDVTALGCSVLTGTGRKWLRGPRGTGVLYVDPDWLEHMVPIFVDGSSAEWLSADRFELAPGAARFDRFETSVAAQLGLGAALDQLLVQGIEPISARIVALAETLRDALAELGCTLHDGAGRRCGIVTFTVPGVEPPAVVDAAALAGVNIGSSLAHSARIDMDARGLDRVVRASPHAYNTEDEIDQLVEVVRNLVR